MLFLQHSLCPSATPPPASWFVCLFLNPVPHLYIYYPRLLSRTALGSQSPFLDSSGRKIVSREQRANCQGEGQDQAGFWSSPLPPGVGLSPTNSETEAVGGVLG